MLRPKKVTPAIHTDLPGTALKGGGKLLSRRKSPKHTLLLTLRGLGVFIEDYRRWVFTKTKSYIALLNQLHNSRAVTVGARM